MKHFFSLLFAMCISATLFASHVTLSLTGVTNNSSFYYCSTSTDSVITYKPAGGGTGSFFSSIFGYVVQDSLIITAANQGNWIWSDGNTTISFDVYFVSTSPTEPWTATTTSKCPGTAITLTAQSSPQPDFSYQWSSNAGGATTNTINVTTPGIYAVTVTGACATVNDQMEVIDYSAPVPSLGPDVVTCDGNIVTLDPGTFVGYSWSTGSTTPTIDVSTDGNYSVLVTDVNGCTGSDAVNIAFLFPPTPSIEVVTVETDPASPLYGNNKPTWETNLLNVDSVVIWRETTTNNYEVVGAATYSDGAYTDNVSSKFRAWGYKIQFKDTCGNLSTLSLYHKTSKVSINYSVGGYTVAWTLYEIEGGAKPIIISKYEIYTGEFLNALSYLDYVPSPQDVYGPFAFTDSLVVVAAVITTTSKSEITAFSYPITAADTAASVGEENMLNFDLYPNPSNGVFTISAEGKYIVSVYNSSVELIFSEEMTDKKQFSLNTVPGLYLIRITDQYGTAGTKKVIIQ